VSGGERKRVSVAEALVSNARVVCLDEISTGLDSSVTYDIIACIAAWAHTMRSTVVISLQQPTPEVYGLFDDIVLLREGCTVYHGPREGVAMYLRKLGFKPPKGSSAVFTKADGPTGQSIDMADWLLDFLTSPTTMIRRDDAERRHMLAGASLNTNGGAAVSAAPPTTTALLARAWTESGKGYVNTAPASADAHESGAMRSMAAPRLRQLCVAGLHSLL
jgi:ABC-type multidrug transport system ATPase subunit